MKLPGLAAFWITMLMTTLFIIHTECNFEVLPRSWLRRGPNLNPITKVRNLFSRGYGPKIVPLGQYPLWKVHKYNGIALNPVAVVDSAPGGFDGVPVKPGKAPTVVTVPHATHSPENELEPPRTQYDPPNYTGLPQQFNLPWPVHTAPETSYNLPNKYPVPQSSYAPLSEYAVPTTSYSLPTEYSASQASLAPPTEYSVPQTNLVPPTEYSAPQTSLALPTAYAAPQTGYSVPTEYSEPQTIFTPPNEYGPPNNEYNAPPPSEYGPPSAYGPPSEYGPPNNDFGNSGGSQQVNTDASSEEDTASALNALDAIGPLTGLLDGAGGLDIETLVKIVTSLPDGTVDKLVALLGLYNAKNNQERWQSLADAANATLRLKAGVANSVANFVQDTIVGEDDSNTTVTINQLGSNTLNGPFANIAKHIAATNPVNIVSNLVQTSPLAGIAKHLASTSRGNLIPNLIPISPFSAKFTSNLGSNNPYENTGFPIPGTNSAGVLNLLRNLVLGNNGDASNLAIESGTYKNIPNGYPGRPGWLPLIRGLSGTSRDIPLPDLPEPPPLPSIPFLSKLENEIKPPKLPNIYVPTTYTLPDSKVKGPYVSIRLPKPVTKYSIPNTEQTTFEKPASNYEQPVPRYETPISNSVDVYTPPVEQPAPLFNSVQSYSAPSSTYSAPVSASYSISQGDSNSFQPSLPTTYGVPETVYGAPQESFSQISSQPVPQQYQLPQVYGAPQRFDHNIHSNLYTSYNVPNDISAAASEQQENVKDSPEENTGYSRVILQNRQVKSQENETESQPKVNQQQVDLRMYLDPMHPESTQKMHEKINHADEENGLEEEEIAD